jgi:hypothetical protein
VKKTEILKVRIDMRTHVALVQYSEREGRSVSSVLRDLIHRELRLAEERSTSRGDYSQKDGAEMLVTDQMRNVCARVLTSILIGRRAPAAHMEGEGLPAQAKIFRTLDRLLGLLCQEENFAPTTHECASGCRMRTNPAMISLEAEQT